MNVIYYINDKCLIQSMRKHKTCTKLGSWVPQGRRLGDDHLEVLVLLVALGELLCVTGNCAAVGYPQREQEEKSRGGNQN